MKQRRYEIRQDGQVKSTKFAWNTARREIRSIIGEQLLNGEKAELFSKDYKRDEQNLAFVQGSEIWHTSTGRTLVFQIVQV